MCQQELEILEVIEITKPTSPDLPVEELYCTIVVQDVKDMPHIAAH